jgi:hypothetical protein
MRERKMAGDIGKAGIRPQETILDENSPIAAFGEKRLVVVAAQDLPPARFTGVGSIETHIKTFEELSVTSLEDLTSVDKADVQSRLNSLKQIEPDLDSTQQSLLRTIVNHLQFALDTNSSAQRFMLGQAKKELEKLQSSLESQTDKPLDNESPKSRTPGFVRQFVNFLVGLLSRPEKPVMEAQKPEPAPVPVIVQESVVKTSQVLDSVVTRFVPKAQYI